MGQVGDVHLFASPHDGVVVPWQSELFGFFNESMTQTPLYRGDLFGLRTLDEAGRVHLHTVAGVEHGQWLTNMTNFARNVLPLLV